jgi:hypothetical protein
MGNCTVMRRVLVKHSTLDLETGQYVQGKEEWVTRPCGKPLFSDAEKQSGKCKSCQKGWTHPENYPV